MITIDEDGESIIITEHLTWAQPKLRLETIQDEIQDIIFDLDDEMDKSKYKKVIEAIEAGFDKSERIEILNEIAEFFEDVSLYESDVSIFEDFIVDSAIYSYLERKYDVEMPTVSRYPPGSSSF